MYGQDLGADYAEELLPMLGHPGAAARGAAARALPVALRAHPDTTTATLTALSETFTSCPSAGGRVRSREDDARWA